MNYDIWRTTDPDDELLGPDPEDHDEEPEIYTFEEIYLSDLSHANWNILCHDYFYVQEYVLRPRFNGPDFDNSCPF